MSKSRYTLYIDGMSSRTRSCESRAAGRGVLHAAQPASAQRVPTAASNPNPPQHTPADIRYEAERAGKVIEVVRDRGTRAALVEFARCASPAASASCCLARTAASQRCCIAAAASADCRLNAAAVPEHALGHWPALRSGGLQSNIQVV